MTTPTVIISGAWCRNCQILRLDGNDIVYSTGTTVYAGVTVSGAKALTINDPEPRQIVHIGDDRPFALDVLPATEPITGELRAGKANDTVDALVQGVNSIAIGESKLYPIGTDKRGNESQVAMLAYREAVDTDPDSGTFGKRVWQWRLFPKCYVIPRESGFEDNAEERSYTIRPQFATKYPWGVTFSTSTEGCLQAQGFRGVSEYKPTLISYVADNTKTSFALSPVAAGTGKIACWKISTAGVGTPAVPDTLGTASIAFTTAPTTGTLVILYETP